MQWLKWIISVFLVIVFVWISLLNAFVFWRQFVSKLHTASWIPLVGGICGLIAAILLPLPSVNRLWWLPLFVDSGSLPGLLYTGVWHVRRISRGLK